MTGLVPIFCHAAESPVLVAGATLGGIFGSLIRINTEGLDFAMTAMFVVIFLEQVAEGKAA